MSYLALREDCKAIAAYEYFCKHCFELRLSFTSSDTCGNCGSDQIIKGKIGELDRSKLIDEIHQETKT